MKHLNFLSKSSSRSCGHRVTTLASTVGSPSAHRRGAMLRLLSVLVLILTIGVGNMWGAAASLPFSYDGGNSTSITGLTCSGLGSNYSSSPKMKLDHAGDYVMVQFSDTPDKLGYKLKTNGSGSGTFKFEVLQSADGSSWSEVKTYNSTPSGTATESNIQLSSSSRYVKFIYTTKVSGINMGLGAISISKATASKTLSSIAITTQPTKRKYLVGQTFSSSGAVVRATYSDASTANVTASWTPTTALTAGTGKTITASYTEGGVNKTATTTVDVYSVTVQVKDEDGNTLSGTGMPTASASGASITASASGNNYVFKQWEAVTAAGTSFASSSSASTTLNGNPTGDVTIKAVYRKPITVTYKANGQNFTSQTYGYGGTLVFPASDPDGKDYSCTGKTFVGWVGEANKDYSDASTPPTYATAGGSVTAAATYYAVFADAAAGGGTTTKTDELTYTSFFNACTPTGSNTNGSYTAFSGKSGSESDAVYAGLLFKHGNGPSNCKDYIQMRTSSNNSGIVTTTSGGKAKKVTVEWNSATGNAKEVNIYGKNTAYSAASELYDDETDGDLLGTITKGTSTECTITGDYEYIGLRSRDGSVYFDDISIDWQAGGGVTYSNYATSCCTSLGSINGSFFWTTPFCPVWPAKH